MTLAAIGDRYDLALIIGPEGFAYEPVLNDLGLKTLAVNIPEADPGGRRTVQTFAGEDLRQAAGKCLLIVEDDIRSGATVEAALQALPGAPKKIGLFLGSPPAYQKLENVPGRIAEVHTIPAEAPRNLGPFFDLLRDRYGLDVFA